MNGIRNKKDEIPKIATVTGESALITTIIPTYRRPKLLRRAIRSALAQTYPHVRVCVYDDVSNDETADVVEDIIREDSRVSYYCHPKNCGSVCNYNYAFKNIRTPFFSLLADDDILLPEFYEIAVEGLNKYPEAAFYATDVIPMKPDGTVVEVSNSWGNGYYLPPEGLLAMCQNGRYPPIWTGTLFRTMVIEHIGLLDEEVGTIYDHDYSQRIAAVLPYITSKIPGAIYLVNPVSMSFAIDHDIAWRGAMRMISNLTDDNRIPLSVREQVRDCLTRALVQRTIGHGKECIISKRHDRANNIANILYRHLDAKLWASTIYVTSKCCSHFDGFHGMLLYLIDLRHRLRSQKRNGSISDTRKYAHYLKEV